MQEGGETMEEIHTILKQIEELRQKLNRMATEKNILDPEVLRLSQHLDEMINKYQRLSNRDK
jgi:regulator of replication initiation timing